MGINGLIPFLEKAATSVNIKQLEGSSVAVDSYCWLHKGVFACAEKLIRGETTDIHIQYCLKYVDMLLRYKIRVIMVFDGKHLPAKAETERRRREARNESKQLAKEYLRMNDIEKARSYMRRAVDVTHEMALELIKACRKRGIDCIVAPYEADAQLAWLNKKGLTEYIITEDSDLTLFGTQKILFKLDLTGQALLVENSKLYLAMGCKPEKYTFNKFLRMCIISGCDYLDSLKGIGLKKACKFILTTEENDMTKALKKIPSYLKMNQLEVTSDYIESFLKAEATFKHMFIYNPLERRMERLHELDEFKTDERHCDNAGSLLDNSEQAFQLALGNLNPFTLKQVDDWHPDQNCKQSKSKHNSIWQSSKDAFLAEQFGASKNLCENVKGSMFHFKKIEFKNMAEMEIEEKLFEEKRKLAESEIYSMYKYASPKMERKRKRRQSSSSSCEDEQSGDICNVSDVLEKVSHNPFAKINTEMQNIQKSPICTNSSLLKVLSPKKANVENDRQPTAAKTTSIKSRFFAKNITLKKSFAARDLTCEMLKIEKKSNEYMGQQQDLYSCYLKSPKKNCEELSDNSDRKTKENHVKCTNYDDDSISNTETSKSIHENKTFESAASNAEIILHSDNEEDQCFSKFATLSSHKKLTESLPIKLKTNFPRKAIKTLGTTDPNQTKLSKFGFQKRPSLKKF